MSCSPVTLLTREEVLSLRLEATGVSLSSPFSVSHHWGGPCGLRTAIELAYLGAKVVVVKEGDTLPEQCTAPPGLSPSRPAGLGGQVLWKFCRFDRP